MTRKGICPDCGGPMYRYATTCNACKGKGERNAMFGKRHSPETRELIAQRASERDRAPRKRRSTSEQSGREYARRWYELPEKCEDCDEPPLDRHHIDGNTNNNAPENIAFLCRRCHQKRDGRHEFVSQVMPSMGGRARTGGAS